MVKTRSQQRITFPLRKSKTRGKSVRKSSDSTDSKEDSCCLATLARVCRDKQKDVEIFEKSHASPAKKSRRDSQALPRMSLRRGNITEHIQEENDTGTSRRTRRILSYEEDQENNPIQTAVTRTTKPRKHCTTDVEEIKSSPKLAKNIADVIVHNPVKSNDHVMANKVSQCGTPVKAQLRLERTVGRRLTSCRSATQLSPRPGMVSVAQPGKRRHSSAFVNENMLMQHNETRVLTSSLTAKPGLKPSLSESSLENTSPDRRMMCLSRQEGKVYKEAKHALHSSIPSNLLCRETETKQIETFLKVHLVRHKSGSLYISGAPGTGKTACLTHILEHLQKDGVECQVRFINCMNLSRSHRIFSKIAEELTGWDKLTNKEAEKFLEKKFTTKGLPMVLVLDEIDQLESKNQDVLYTMFEWPALPSSRLILIGIANALDLTDRVLPRLQLRPECKPKLLHFSPYSKDQIVKILTARLSEVEGSSIVDVSAVQFCARKIAAVSGDMRKALDICRRAVELVETEVRRQQILKPIDFIPSPKKSGMKKVTIAHVSKVISEVYGSRIVSSCGGEQPTIPLQQKLLICTILLMQKESKLREIPVGKLHETYCSICKKRQVSQISHEDCLSLCNLLETRGIISMKRAKETRMTKVSLKIDENEVDHALQDKILMTSILQGGLSPS